MMQKLIKSTSAEIKDSDEDCQVSDCPGCVVHKLTVGEKERCFTLYTPTTGSPPADGWPVMVYFHGMGGQAKSTCSTKKKFGKDDHVTNPEYAEQLGFALLCADSDENWQFPTVTGTITSPRSKSYGETKNDDPGVGENNLQACSETDNADAVYVKGLLDTLDASEAYDSKRIYFMGFSQGAGFTAWAATCFADRIRGAVQAGTGLKVAGDGYNVPGGACETECSGCKFFPIQPGSEENRLTNAVGDELKWCLYAGCGDYLLGSIRSMDNYLSMIDAPHEIQYYDADHEAPANWFPMIFQCHELPNAPAEYGLEAHWLKACTELPDYKAGADPIVDGSGCEGNENANDDKPPKNDDAENDDTKNKPTKPTPRACTERKTTRCCGDQTCEGSEDSDNCPVDCGGDTEDDDMKDDDMKDDDVEDDDTDNKPTKPKPRACNGKKKNCCGDTICSGPETADNCPSDCN